MYKTPEGAAVKPPARFQLIINILVTACKEWVLPSHCVEGKMLSRTVWTCAL